MNTDPRKLAEDALCLAANGVLVGVAPRLARELLAALDREAAACHASHQAESAQTQEVKKSCLIRMPAELKRQLVARATSERRSFNSQVVKLLEDGLDDDAQRVAVALREATRRAEIDERQCDEMTTYAMDSMARAKTAEARADALEAALEEIEYNSHGSNAEPTAAAIAREALAAHVKKP